MKDFHARHRGQEVDDGAVPRRRARRAPARRRGRPAPLARPHGPARPRADGGRGPAGPGSGASRSGRRSRRTRTGWPPPSPSRPARRGTSSRSSWRGRRPRPRSPSARSRAGSCSTRSPTSRWRRTAGSRSRRSPTTSPRTVIVYGTGRQVEANHTLALRFQSVLADALLGDPAPGRPGRRRWTTRPSPPTTSSSSGTRATTRSSPGSSRSCRSRRAPGLLPLRGHDVRRRAGRPLPRPPEPLRATGSSCTCSLANSPLQLHEMTKTYRAGLPAWAVFRGEKVEKEGHFPVGAVLPRGEVTA